MFLLLTTLSFRTVETMCCSSDSQMLCYYCSRLDCGCSAVQDLLLLHTTWTEVLARLHSTPTGAATKLPETVFMLILMKEKILNY